MHQTNQALLPCQTIRREIQREWFCLASINRQFIQSALRIWDWISFTILEIHSETKCTCYEYRETTCMSMEMPAAWGSQQVRWFHSAEIWKKENCLFITNSNTQMSVAEHITILNWNARPSLYKLFLLLILPFSKLKTAYNSDTLKSTQMKKGLREVLINILYRHQLWPVSFKFIGVWTRNLNEPLLFVIVYIYLNWSSLSQCNVS